MTGRRTLDFTRDSGAPRVVFATGAFERIPRELDALGSARALLITTEGRFRTLAGRLETIESHLAGTFTEARVHVPEAVVEGAVARARDGEADALLALGGGSAIGVAKAVARETGIPILAVPTTYSGSEMTSVWGMRTAEGKATGRDPGVAPRSVIYDPELTVELPPDASAASGVNAIAHCVEALYAENADPVASLLAEEAIRVLIRALPVVADAPHDIPARSDALLGAYLAGSALEGKTMGLHHKLCHVLGGLFDLPHALTHAILLPYVTAYNAPFAGEAMDRLERAFGGPPAEALSSLNRRLGIDRTLADLGPTEADLERAAEVAGHRPYPNPGPVTYEAVHSILEAAWKGTDPTEVR